MWKELNKKGYEVTNKGLLFDSNDPSTERYYHLYLTEEDKRKDLIQELSLILDWIETKFTIFVNIQSIYLNNVHNKIAGFIFWFAPISLHSLDDDTVYQTKIEATIASIEFLLKENLI